MATTHEYDYSITNHPPTTRFPYHTTKPPTTHLSIRNTSTTDTTLITIHPQNSYTGNHYSPMLTTTIFARRQYIYAHALASNKYLHLSTQNTNTYALKHTHRHTKTS